MAVQDAPGRGNDRLAAFLMWYGHHSAWLLWAAIPCAVTGTALGLSTGLASYALSVPMVLWMGALGAEVLYHRENLCPWCARETPLDPQGAVDRWRPALRFSHGPGRLIAGITVLGVFLGLARIWPPPWWVILAEVLSYIVLGLTYASIYQHRRLYPWCPWCHWDDGGEEEVSPDIPAPAVSR